MHRAVVGGTGTLGRLVTAELRRRGREVRVLSRSSLDFPVDLASGRGLASALAGSSGRALRAGALTAANADVTGAITFADWLALELSEHIFGSQG